jgi:ubiquitin-protein ligase
MASAKPLFPRNPRQDRLRAERERLEALNRESDHVQVLPVDVLPGSEPERYKATFRCRGIVGIDASRRPVYGDQHVVLIHCDESFPSDAPRLRWVTPIWHPNIQHIEPKGVCVNKSEWLGGMGLDDLCRQMFEMVQYKNYHADLSPPFPLDSEVARWVREYAQPNGVVDKKRRVYVDDQPFTRPTAGRPAAQPAPRPKVKILTAPAPASKRPAVRVLPAAPRPAAGSSGPTRRVTIREKKG